MSQSNPLLELIKTALLQIFLRLLRVSHLKLPEWVNLRGYHLFWEA